MKVASISALRPRVLLTLAACLAATAAPTFAQQYYYQPSPDYYRNDTREGTVVGGGLGAITGALIGGKKNWEGGALIGAGVGALTGRALGSARDQADAQQLAIGTSVANQANAQAAANAVTNYDLQQMTSAGLSDELIISTIQSRGGRFDMSPAGLIALKRSGVSDRVVLAAQQVSGNTVPTPINPTVRVATPPPVYVRPAPVIHYYHGPRCYHHRYYHHW